MQRMEENNKVRAVVDMMVPGKKTKREMDRLLWKGHAGTVDHPGGCPGLKILAGKNLGL